MGLLKKCSCLCSSCFWLGAARGANVAGPFGHGHEVVDLDFSHCSLEEVPGAVFGSERTLEVCLLDSNQIRDLPRVSRFFVCLFALINLIELIIVFVCMFQ